MKLHVFAFFALAACTSRSGSIAPTRPGDTPEGSDPTGVPAAPGEAADGGAHGGDTAAGGGGGVSSTDSTKQASSGTRLKARVYKATDGAEQFIGWRDTERDEDCYFQASSDGKLRCMPAAGGALGNNFSDSGCSSPLVPTLKTCATPKYASRAAGTTCGTKTELHPIGAAFAGSTVYSGAPGSCTGTATSVYATFTFYAFGPEIPAASFVEAAEELR